MRVVVDAPGAMHLSAKIALLGLQRDALAISKSARCSAHWGRIGSRHVPPQHEDAVQLVRRGMAVV